MIDVKKEDFEKYRGKLNLYTKNLLNTKGYANWEDVKDYVQDSYFKFHKAIDKGNKYNNEDHLWASLKVSLYHTVCEARAIRLKNGQRYQKERNFHDFSKFDNKIYVLKYDNFLDIKENITKDQLKILELRLKGKNTKEIGVKCKKSTSTIRRELLGITNKFNVLFSS